MIDEFLSALNLPVICFENTFVSKKTIFEQRQSPFTATDKKIFKEDIEKIRWLHTLKPERLNIPAFADDAVDYREVIILHIMLTARTRVKRIAEKTQQSLPSPAIILLTFGADLFLCVCDKRINQADKSKRVIENFRLSGAINASVAYAPDFLADCMFTAFSTRDMRALYDDFTARMIALTAAEKTGVYNRRDATAPTAELLSELENAEKQEMNLCRRLKASKREGERAELNSDIYKTRLYIKKLKEQF